MRMQPVLEKAVVACIMRALKTHPGIVVRKRHGTAMGVAGDPDLYGTIRGRHFEIEVKRPGDRNSQLTRLQAERLLQWKMAGAITGVARSVPDALKILALVEPDNPDRTVWLCALCRDYRYQGAAPPVACACCGHKEFMREGGHGE